MLAGLVLLEAVAAGDGLADGELLAPVGAGLPAEGVALGPVALADGEGDGLAGAALPTAPPPKVVP